MSGLGHGAKSLTTHPACLLGNKIESSHPNSSEDGLLQDRAPRKG